MFSKIALFGAILTTTISWGQLNFFSVSPLLQISSIDQNIGFYETGITLNINGNYHYIDGIYLGLHIGIDTYNKNGSSLAAYPMAATFGSRYPFFERKLGMDKAFVVAEINLGAAWGRYKPNNSTTSTDISFYSKALIGLTHEFLKDSQRIGLALSYKFLKYDFALNNSYANFNLTGLQFGLMYRHMWGDY